VKTLPGICIALGFPDAGALLAAASHEADHGETFFEFRLDHLKRPEDGVRAIRTFLKDRPDCQVLATCRRRQNAGGFDGAIEEQVRLLGAAAEAGAKAVDLEIESACQAPEALAALRRKARLVVSYHNFESTPALEPVLRRLRACPADAYKVVPTARKPGDMLRVLTLVRANPRERLIAFSMGEIGFATRVLTVAPTPMRPPPPLPARLPGRSMPARCAASTAWTRSAARRGFTASSPIRSGTRFRPWCTTAPSSHAASTPFTFPFGFRRRT
jgi:3-dehydroquinate dehydratase/shikimate dehydrogenase